VSALDMTVQKQILELIRKLQEKRGFACLFVSHDLGAVEQVADRVAVMENGRIVEIGDRDEVFDRPKHPYTKRLLEAAMLLDRKFEGAA
jgi:peptide/nickel transport system ATP-binding protein